MSNLRKLLALALVLAASAAKAQPSPTPAYTANMPAICAGTMPFPALPTWASIVQPAQSATSGTPRIEQWRAGHLVATYPTLSSQPGCTLKMDGTDSINPQVAASTGCGPFNRVPSMALWQSGDDFKVYPAVYTGPYNSLWLGTSYASYASYIAGQGIIPANITIEGVVQGGRRPVILLNAPTPNNTLGQAPVLLANGTNITWHDINVQAVPGAVVGKALMYVDDISNLDISDTRISGAYGLGNGLFSTVNTTGLLRLDGVELDHNGGGGQMHNAYIGGQNALSLLIRHSYFHDATIGHEFKSRAAVTTVIGSYFGGSAGTDAAPGDVYDLDVPNGGNLTVRNSILVKLHSGAQTNGAIVTFGVEGLLAGRTHRIALENNTLVAGDTTFDGSHPIYPYFFLYPPAAPASGSLAPTPYQQPYEPGAPSSPVPKRLPLIPVAVERNVLAGFCPQPGAMGYAGGSGVLAAPGDLVPGFGLTDPIAMPGLGGAPAGQEGYRAHAVGAARKTTAVGAVD